MQIVSNWPLKAKPNNLRMSLVGAAVVLSVFLSGCSGKTGFENKYAKPTIKDDLKVLYRAYENYIDLHLKGPPDWQAFISASNKEADALKRCRDAGVSVKWGARFRDATDGMHNFVLAEAPNGGPKLTLDGGVSD